MDEDLDLYDVLGIERTATKTEIKKAYHKAALSSHPDKVPEADRSDAEVRFKTINQAYEILHDEEKRERYDRFGMEAFGGGGGPGGGVDLDDLLAQMFMNGMGGMGGMPGMNSPGGSRRKARGRDVVQDYEVTLEELYKGKTVKWTSTRNILCSVCKGTGGKDKAKPRKCATCNGNGWVNSLRQIGRGLMTQEQHECGSCKGTGQIFREKERCKKCKGNCVLEEKKVLELYIPRGSKNGDRIVLEGEADEAPNTETGDIVFVVREKPHEVFTREEADLLATIKVSLAEALCGFSRVVVKHLDGRGISIHHPRGKVLKQGQVLKVEGEGMPHKKGDRRGNLFLLVELEFPTEGWLAKSENIKNLEAVLPKPTRTGIEAEHVDEVQFDPASSVDEFGADGASKSHAAWVEDEEEEDDGPQCAQQ